MAKPPEKISSLDKKIDRVVLKRLADMFRGVANGLERELRALEGEMPFRGLRTARAIEKILRDQQSKTSEPVSMTPFELMELLIEGGSAVGDTDDPKTNLDRSIKQGANEGYLVILDDGAVALPAGEAKASG